MLDLLEKTKKKSEKSLMKMSRLQMKMKPSMMRMKQATRKYRAIKRTLRRVLVVQVNSSPKMKNPTRILKSPESLTSRKI